MDYGRFRKISLSGFIGFLALTAVIAIVSVLTDSFDTLQTKILATTFSISASTVCAMICAVYGEKLNHRNLAVAGISTCVMASLLVIAGIWVEWPHLHINMIGVRKSHRGSGCGRLLMRYAHHMSAIDENSQGITLTTEREENISFYKRLGYEVVGSAVVSDDLTSWGFYRGNRTND